MDRDPKARENECLETHPLFSRSKMKITWAGYWGSEGGKREVARGPKRDGAWIPCKVVRISNLKTVGTC